MNKKFGKFKLWQLIAAGVALGVIFYIYSKNKGEGTSAEELYGGTGTGAYGPIDPNTGVPYAFEGGAGGATAPGTMSFEQGLAFIEQLKNAGLLPEPGKEAGEHTETVIEKEGPEPKTNAEVKAARMAAKATREQLHKVNKALEKLKAKSKKQEHGHTQKHHKTGDSAHAPGTHHSKEHPGDRTHAAKEGAKNKHYQNRNQKHENNRQKQRNRRH